ncbi:MAG: hypothetical protein KAR83_09795, partial [Thermodesulfovibrionales bacterium]|nr:hypothetical protein [Thermodesulfovibrionales bacterium]
METHELIDKTVGKATGWTMPFDDQYPADSRKRAQVTREKTRLLYSSAPIEITVALLFTITIVFILWGKAGNSVLLPWAGINLLLLVARSVLVFRYIRIRNISLFNASRCFNFFLAGLFASGVAFGSAAFVLLPIDFSNDALTGLILGGLAVGAVGFYSVSLHVFFLYCLP